MTLDEATNATDRLSETAVVKSVRSLPPGTTVILISHRASILCLCDAGVVLEEGRVIEAGSLDALVEYREIRDREAGAALSVPDDNVGPSAGPNR